MKFTKRSYKSQKLQLAAADLDPDILSASIYTVLARYTSTYSETKAPPTKSRQTTVTELDYTGNTYEKIRERISRLLESPRAQEFNRHVRLDSIYSYCTVTGGA